MRRSDALGHLDSNADAFPDVKVPLLGDIFLQGDAFHQFHHNVVQFLFVHDIVDADDVRMIQSCRGLGFHLEFPDELLVLAEFFFQELDGHKTVQLVAARPVDLGHAAASDQFQDLIAVLEKYAVTKDHTAAPFP